MSSGKGLESLIPPNQQKNSQPPAQQEKDIDTTNVSSQPTNQSPKEDFQKSEPKSEESFKTSKKTEENKKDLVNKNQKDGEEAVFQIEVDKIKPNPYQPRKEYNENNLKDLGNSIREVGIIQPLVVSKVEEETENGTRVEYQLISGERRLRASKLIGLERVPAIVRNIGLNKDKLSVALIENIQRDDLNPIEKARGYARLQDEFNLTQREVATKVGKARSSIANTLRLLNLPSEIQDALAEQKINESQARLLLSIEEQDKQHSLFQQLLDNNISTKDLRSKVKKNNNTNDSSSTNKENEKSREEIFWEKQLEEKFSTPVEISRKGNEGKLMIKFFSREEWKTLLNKLLE